MMLVFFNSRNDAQDADPEPDRRAGLNWPVLVVWLLFACVVGIEIFIRLMR